MLDVFMSDWRLYSSPLSRFTRVAAKNFIFMENIIARIFSPSWLIASTGRFARSEDSHYL